MLLFLHYIWRNKMSYITSNNEFAALKLEVQEKRLITNISSVSTNLTLALNRKKSIPLFGLPLINSTLKDTVDTIVSAAALGERNTLQFINAHCVNIYKKNPDYRDAIHKVDAILPDGSGLKLAGKMANTDNIPNLNGTDLFPLLCEKLSKTAQSLFLFGGKQGIAAATSKNMRNEYPGLKVAGTQHGYFASDEEEAIIEQINASGANIVLVGMGVPQQEIWIEKNRSKLKAPIVMGVGGLFDYYSGRIPRAPLFMRKTGLEWVWRFLCEPRRLAGRYINGNIKFLMHAAQYTWEARGYKARYSHISKRILDMAIAFCALIILGPIAAALCLFITLEDKGSPFFKQTRIGEDGKPFKIWKFRSMYSDAEARKAELSALNERDSVCFKMKDDPRITTIGKFIRRASIDELPQIFNVLTGDMSIVGPRPALPNEVLSYGQKERQRLDGKPGITCTWQVSGRADIPFEQQVELDVEYLEKKSLWQDIKLIFKTIPAVISGKGAY